MSDEEDYDIWYVCKICREAFPNKEDLCAHRKTEHVEVCPRGNHNSSLSDAEITKTLNLSPSEEIIANNKTAFPETDKCAERVDAESEIEKDWPILNLNTLENLKTAVNVQINSKKKFKSKYSVKVESKTETENVYTFDDSKSESMEETYTQFAKRKKHNHEKSTPLVCGPKRNQKLIECAICGNTSTSDLMIGCNSCTVHFHLTCVGSEDGPIVRNKEVYCARCANENQQDEYDDFQEINALRNIKRRNKSRKTNNLSEIVPNKPEIRIKKSPNEFSSEKFVFYECDQCKKLFISKVNLAEHYKIHGDGQWSANNCQDKIFSINADDLSCPLCHVSFGQKLDQMVHIASHAEENKISTAVYKEKSRIPSIDVKLKTLKKSSPKNSHKRKGETSERPTLLCAWCERICKSSTQLSEHMGVHTGEKTHECKYCSKCFRLASGLSRHVKNLHPKKTRRSV